MVQVAGDINHSRPPAGGGNQDLLTRTAFAAVKGSSFLQLIAFSDAVCFKIG